MQNDYQSNFGIQKHSNYKHWYEPVKWGQNIIKNSDKVLSFEKEHKKDIRKAEKD